ncbi:S24 family peptidase [Sphingopyxis sp. J-6]|uniref:LexA family transcriptional regulator n=1 Tax=Sphingopyxis sp. J-6 TaxID=3122054 RepID=UPI00398403FE
MVNIARLNECLQAIGISQSELARRVGVAQGTIAGLFTGRQRGSKYIYRIAAELGTSPQYLMGEDLKVVASPRRGFQGPPPSIGDENAELSEIDLLEGVAGFKGVGARKRTFSRALLRNFTDAPAESLVVAYSIGDDMRPTIDVGDAMLIDRSQNTLNAQNKIWVAAFGKMTMIKRLNPRPNAKIQILSDNPVVPADTAEAADLKILGRVVAVFRKT